ncbi:tetratricopeptide repeat protein [Actinoplanes sp. TBRC 11911]|uniref:tetratricopeptide repeat protein n=1 Tax=Actinoplanes sp. TBRC 11911 TaxID=2729386 RepID=UPI00145F8409|nr:tetratricopeptide repeat protein [Actinoplanes sp. TBRC 11911]NMO56967.1 tetratricopeptide repeat protein [Actinoplanes sp. TBRC 11911]
MTIEEPQGAVIERTLDEAYQAFDAEQYGRAGDLLAGVAAAVEPELAKALWFDAALCALRIRDWAACRDRGLEAVRFVERGTNAPAYWNLGTAATALRDWDLARDCWVGFGMDPIPGTGPIDTDGGPTCIRLDIDEVVWARRIDPVRARVLNVPFDPSRRYGEIVLHSGAPSGERVLGGVAYPVFDELGLFEASELATLAVVVAAEKADDIEDLAARFAHDGYGMEILESRVDRCSCCSQGRHESERGRFAGEQPLYVAAPEDTARAILDGWTRDRPHERSWTDLRRA